MSSLMEWLKKYITLERCVIRFIMAWCLVSIVQTLKVNKSGVPIDNIKFLKEIHIVVMILTVAVIFVTFYTAFELVRSINPMMAVWGERILLFTITMIYAIICVYIYKNIYFLVGMAALMTFSVTYLFKGVDTSKIGLSRPVYIALMVTAGLIFILFTASCMVVRCLSYYAPNFDMGIFSQMFHYMRTTGRMLTTCERDRLMSHMCVHIAPDFYLVLPFYALFPSPETLEVIQVVVLALAIIPLSKICRLKKLSSFETVLIVVGYAFYPVVSGGCFYDVHENMFFPLFLFTFIYFMEKDHFPGMVVSMLLVWGIKEDAIVFILFISLYMIFGKKMVKKGLFCFLTSLVYFVFAVKLLSIIGTGVFSNRFNNMIYEQNGSIVSIIKTVFANPAYIMTQMLKAEKFEYILQTMGPLLFLPLFSKKWYRFILIGPYVMFNLMADYQYFHNIFFQYSFGPCALLLYMAVLNLSDMDIKVRSKAIPMLAVSCVLFFSSIMLVRLNQVFEYNTQYYRARNEKIREGLDKIPDDASVIATTFFCTPLSERKVLYELYYTDKTAEYIALDLRGNPTDYNINDYLENDRYETVYYEQNLIGVFRDKTY